MLSFATVFQSGMTLQREKPIRLFGTTGAAQTLRVTLNGTALAEAEISAGAFSLLLPPQPAAEDAVLRVEASVDGAVVFDHVDIGEVWIAGGQSNMEYAMVQDADAADVIQQAQDEHLRFYDVAKWAFPGEEAEGMKDASHWERWMTWNPDDAGYFSAVAAWCALELRRTLQVPVAIIGCNWGGTTAATWTDRAVLEQDADLKAGYCDTYEAGLKTIDLKQYEENRITQKKILSDPEIKTKINDYIKQAMENGLLDKMRQMLDTIGPKSENRPGALYETMVSKIAGVACRGVLWYQGESDDKHPTLYEKLFPAMIGCWRRTWGEELPFLFVQLAPFGSWGSSTGEVFPILRAAQDVVQKKTPACYMVSIMDSGEELDIHPKHKRPVGHRLALMALGKIYGQNILCEAPELVSARVQPGVLTLQFANAGDGLHIQGETLQAAQLIVSGAKAAFTAAAEGDTLTLQSPALDADAAVQLNFAWTGWCTVNLYNSADLPAKPFCWKNR